MKPGDLVRVSMRVWNDFRAGVGTFAKHDGPFEGQIGIIIDVEKTPSFLGGDEVFVVLLGGVEQRLYDDELEVIDETR